MKSILTFYCILCNNNNDDDDDNNNNNNNNTPERALIVWSDVKEEPRAGVRGGALILRFTVAWPVLLLLLLLLLCLQPKNNKNTNKQKTHPKKASFIIEGVGRREVPGVLGARGHGNPFIENWHAPAGGGVPCWLAPCRCSLGFSLGFSLGLVPAGGRVPCWLAPFRCGLGFSLGFS